MGNREAKHSSAGVSDHKHRTTEEVNECNEQRSRDEDRAMRNQEAKHCAAGGFEHKHITTEEVNTCDEQHNRDLERRHEIEKLLTTIETAKVKLETAKQKTKQKEYEYKTAVEKTKQAELSLELLKEEQTLVELRKEELDKLKDIVQCLEQTVMSFMKELKEKSQSNKSVVRLYEERIKKALQIVPN